MAALERHVLGLVSLVAAIRQLTMLTTGASVSQSHLSLPGDKAFVLDVRGHSLRLGDVRLVNILRMQAAAGLQSDVMTISDS